MLSVTAATAATAAVAAAAAVEYHDAVKAMQECEDVPLPYWCLPSLK